MAVLIRVLWLGSVVLLAGCFFRPYHIEIGQGSRLSQAKISQIKPGMTQEQVSYILGEPNLKDPFHHNRWDYIYSIEQNHQPRNQRRFTIIFKKGKVDSVSGDYPPPTPLQYKVVKTK